MNRPQHHGWRADRSSAVHQAAFGGHQRTADRQHASAWRKVVVGTASAPSNHFVPMTGPHCTKGSGVVPTSSRHRSRKPQLVLMTDRFCRRFDHDLAAVRLGELELGVGEEHLRRIGVYGFHVHRPALLAAMGDGCRTN